MAECWPRASALPRRAAIGAAADRVHIAVLNSPSLVTLSGDTGPLEAIAGRLEQAGKFVRWLRIAYAFHTHQMDPIKEDLLHALADIRGRAGRVPFVSTVTGVPLRGERLDALYWWKNVRQPVLFAPALANLVRDKEETFLEVGPHPALAASIHECLGEQGRQAGVFHSLRHGADDAQELLTNLAGLHVHGVPLDWAAVNQGSRHVRLPHYPWRRESFWLESPQSRQARLAPVQHPLLGIRIAAAKPTWQVELDLRRFTYLTDHRFWDSSVFPAAGYAEVGIAVARLLFPGEAYVVENLDIKKALFLGDEQPPTVQVIFDPATRTFGVHSSAGTKETWDLHAQGWLTPMPAGGRERFDPAQARQRLTDHFDQEQHFQGLADTGYQFGPQFKLLRNVWRVQGEALAEIDVPAAFEAPVDGYHIHPAVLDACFQLFFRLKVDLTKNDFYLPTSIRRMNLERDCPSGPLWAHGRLRGRRPIVDRGHFRLRRPEPTGRPNPGPARRARRQAAVRRPRRRLLLSVSLGATPAARLRRRRLVPFPSGVRPRRGGACRRPGDLSAIRRRGLPSALCPRVDALAHQSVHNAWLQLGWQPRVGERFTAEELFDRLGVAVQHWRLANAQLHHLSKHGWLRAGGEDAWEVVRVFHEADTSAGWEALAADYPNFATEVVLHQLVSPHLAAVLAGAKDPMEVLFPGGSSEHLERFYVEGVDFPAAAHLIGAAFARLLEALPSGRLLRVLEVGAGTGSLTRVLLPLLPADRTEYLFTDIGPAFLAAARKQFADYPFTDYRIFDVQKDASAQGLEAGGFDLIVGTLVLHATADLKQALRNLRGCLAEGGMLLFQELFPRRHAWDNIFGLLKGWWRFTDTALRQHSPLLERATWLALLGECGFHDAGSFGSATDERESEQAFLFAFAPAAEQDAEAARAPAATGTYMVLTDGGGVGNAVSTRLREHGYRVVQVRAGHEFRQESQALFVVAANSATDLRRVMAHVDCPTDKLAGIVHCWSLDHPPARDLSVEQLSAAQQTGVLSALELIHAVSSGLPQRLWFVTRGVGRVGDADRLEGIASAPLVGLLRVANNEFFPNKFVLIDLDGAPNDEEIASLYHEITGGDGELEIAYRANRRHAIRLDRVQLEQLAVRTRDAVQPLAADASSTGADTVVPFRLQTKKAGILTNLSLNETQRRTPNADEIEIRVRAGGVNFRDLMKALGTYPGNPPDLLWFGDDVAGTVERVGRGVRHLKPGDEVAGMVPYGFRAYVTADARMVFKKPPLMSFEQAATLPTVFLTAHYALNHLARMHAGEKVLIHAGAGGVGQAAIQIAKHLGLEIFATAGTPEKRQLLLDMGVPHVMSSRTLEFADQVMQITAGRGVDAVLNSLAGDFIPKSFSVLAPFGRFLEIGKIDIYKNTAVGLEPFKNNISYFVIDLAQHLEHKPALAATLLREVSERIAAGDYQPLPCTIFPIAQAVEAFRYMAQGKHVGKIVLSFDVPHIPIGPCTDDAQRFRPDATYLITGGAGGFGLELAKWLGRHGARHLVLLSRSGPRDDAAQRDIEQLRHDGIEVVDVRGDVTQLDDVTKIVNRIRVELPPLKGVIHAAMVLDDEFLPSLDAARFNAALNPKMAGAWNLHTATSALPLDHFVCLSSVSNVVGWPKQANYNAGNFFLDALSAYRHARGLPALTINWGALLGTGFVERNRKTAEFLPKIGAGVCPGRGAGDFRPADAAGSDADHGKPSRLDRCRQDVTPPRRGQHLRRRGPEAGRNRTGRLVARTPAASRR